MLVYHISSKRLLSSLARPSLLLRAQHTYIPFQFLRHNTTASSQLQNVTNRPLYPERLIIYHAGTGRTVFLGCLKVTTIFIFSFFCLVVAPTHFYAKEQPKWVAGAVMLSGIIPMASVAYMTAPFVNYIHIRLPSFARHSREFLLRYSKALPKDAELDITTMNFIGKPRVTRVKVSDLYSVKERFGLANYKRDTDKLNARRKWWMGNAVGLFGVHGGRTRIMGGEVWEGVKKNIER